MKHYTPRATRRPNAPTVKGLEVGLGDLIEFSSPDEIDRAVETLQREIRTFHLNVSRYYGNLPKERKNQLGPAYGVWANWYRGVENWVEDTGTWDRLFGSTMDEVNGFRDQLLAQAAALRRAGFDVATPFTFVTPSQKEHMEDVESLRDTDFSVDSPFGQSLTAVKWISIAVVAGLGIYGLTLVAPALRAGSKAAAKKMG